ncbi:hypothetical protein B0J13DRAFT_544605 [Dactylonectria estremocensis]|uniref:Box C/D snoRNA protein 1 n=1 Tax=Dactylonectria estremocensis TaxID=1079267 RepID=A0A9P9F768_9HYPO|nr:hypothetical protein B0J13DRAFT_544605 [Dactylonectria estremocensis]
MADPLLTSLCAICHISAPKYKCPRCDIRTCSLACIKKHKAWSECTGERDATAYVRSSKLRTPAGIDHDYNFLHGIEMSVERSEKQLVNERALIQEEELRPITVQEVKWKPGRDGRKRKVLVTRVLKESKGRAFERLLAQRLKKLNINIVCAPTGMARQKDNHTTLNRRTGRINWQVEWMTFEAQGEGNEGDMGEDNEEEGPKKVRALSKVMDDVQLYKAYHAMLEDQQRAKGQQPKRLARGGQDPSDSTWSGALYTLQDPFTGTWASCQDIETAMWPSERDAAQKRRFQFFLGKHRTRSDLPSSVTPLKAEDCLREILSNCRVLEFPTIYVLNEDETLPAGFVLGPKDAVPLGPNKRKNPSGKNVPGKSAKRRKNGGKALEEGEVKSDEEGVQSDEDDFSGPKGVALEAGDVIAEQSLGEDDDDDDTTSSSGSDSE